MCLCCREDESVQVNPESSSWRHPAEVTQRQSTAKRIEHMRNLWKQKRKFNKRFARPAPVPEPGLLVSAPLKLTEINRSLNAKHIIMFFIYITF
ncbi:coiled-coil domain-containing protein 179 [Ovis canadensis]|uniref:coiled-coil domain-containing protein 179 n=1 Tax=Ovis canadensis TaxID=37174 RepID=UPI003753553F